MNQSIQSSKPPANYSTESQWEDTESLYRRETLAREKAEAEAVLLRLGLEAVCKIAHRVVSPYLTVKERQEAIYQLARWRENANEVLADRRPSDVDSLKRPGAQTDDPGSNQD
ncbi:MAG TPA: hypothetical protein VJ302_13845 [Blastocatellia bacterium]|nr:hypothetical protein [Blastocatellia bacterium]